LIRVLIAEDQALVLGALAALLSLESDIEVVGQVADGEAALAAARALKPDVVVTDVEMPGTTGLDLAEQIASEQLPCKVLVVTTFGRKGYLRRAVDAGVRGYMLKDAPADILADAVRTIAAGGRVITRDLADIIWDATENPLSERERAVLRLAYEGRSNKEIARVCALSPGTVRNYLSEAALKLGVSGRIEAARLARESGWL